MERSSSGPQSSGLRVLAAVDGSAPAMKGVRWAAKLSLELGHALDLVYVSLPNLLPRTVYERTIREMEAAETVHAEQVLADAERSVSDLGVKCLRTRGTGGPAEAI